MNIAQAIADKIALISGDKHLANRAERRKRLCADPRATKKHGRKSHVLHTEKH